MGGRFICQILSSEIRVRAFINKKIDYFTKAIKLNVLSLIIPNSFLYKEFTICRIEIEVRYNNLDIILNYTI